MTVRLNEEKSIFGIFARYDWNDPTYFIGAFKSRDEANKKVEEQYQWDQNNENDRDWNPYFIKELPLNNLAYQRKDVFGMELNYE